MQLSASLRHDVWHDLTDSGSYEWWYFDALDESQTYSFVAIWFSGFPFSPYYLRRYVQSQRSQQALCANPLEHVAFSFNLYKHGREVINFIKEGGAELFSASRNEPFARFERNVFYFDAESQTFHLNLNFEMPLRRKKVRAQLCFHIRPIEGLQQLSRFSSTSPTHAWVLASPSNDVTGELQVYDGKTWEIISFKGRGYHDHNYGRTPMNTDIEHWYWGRAHSHDFDLVYYLTTYRDRAHKPFSFLLLTQNERVLAIEDDLVATEHEHARRFFSPRYGRRFSLTNERLSFDIEHLQALDAGPFYLRFNSKFTLWREDGHAIELCGISESLHPQNLNSGLVRHLIKSKIWRAGRLSVMYTLYNFFAQLFEVGTKKILPVVPETATDE
ncbi:MAG: carotenoid 1,2-hydratase [Chloroherpetonaceae bacterium]|nr:carotenoid 1,2-hydratase [Chloroherpetonaceae bacterium]MCS7211566.1 carotenoid 1,2-hydratase [Chloroherpetonaceae bacterium]MDW8019765.1 carotenoid 1,2-hydratase [Chloroherpetonaceae bacterium]